MNILSQILNYETKNLFIDDILEKIKAKLTNAILSILTNFSKNRYIKSVTVEPISTTLTVTPTTSVQTFTSGPYSIVTVNAAS